MNRWSIPFAVAAILAAAPTARGANVESRQRAAKKACLLGDVDKGAEILADLYVETNDETYIYNQGRCFEQNGKNEQAVLRFKEYLRKAKNLRPADRDSVLKKIAELQGSVERYDSEAPKPASESKSQSSAVPVSAPPARTGPPLAGAASPPEPAAPAADSLGLTQSQPLSEAQASPPFYKRWWFWTGIGAVVAGGIVTGILLSSKSAPQSPACDGRGECVP